MQNMKRAIQTINVLAHPMVIGFLVAAGIGIGIACGGLPGGLLILCSVVLGYYYGLD